MQVPELLLADLRRQRRKVTPQRELIVRLLHGNTSHPTAESLHEAARRSMPSLSLKTVYQVCNELVALGEITMTRDAAGTQRFDPNVSQHHHLLCCSCGKVTDVGLDGALPGPRVGDDALGGFVVEGASVVFRGRCRECAHAARTDAARTDGELIPG